MKPVTLSDFAAIGQISAVDAAELVYGHGTDNSWDEAAWLVLHALGMPVTEEADLELPIEPSQLTVINQIIKQRIETRKPAAYLTGTAWFCGLPFHTMEGVIVPRSHIGGFLLDAGQPWINPNSVKRVLDLCTGSGCIAVAAAMTFPDARVDASDVDHLALTLAEKNIAEYELDGRINLIKSNLYQNLSATYDLILSNPPYVPEAEIDHFPAEYQHEPAAAFDGGADGLDLVHKILKDSPSFLADGGHIVVEVGESWTTLEQAYPKIPFNWLETGVEDSGLLIMDKSELERYF